MYTKMPEKVWLNRDQQFQNEAIRFAKKEMPKKADAEVFGTSRYN